MKRDKTLSAALALLLAVLLTACGTAQAAVTLTAPTHAVALYVGETASVSVQADPADAVVTYVSENENVATVAGDGTVTGVAVGVADITVTAGEETVTVSVTVLAEPESKEEQDQTALELAEEAVSLEAGETYRLTVTAQGADGLELLFASTNPDVAEVDADGLVTAQAPGEAVVLVFAGGVGADGGRDRGRAGGGRGGRRGGESLPACCRTCGWWGCVWR